MGKSGIVGIGVHYGQKNKQNTVFFLEYRCVGCGDPTVLQFDKMTTKELAQELVEATMDTGQSQTPKDFHFQESKNKPAKSGKKSLISDRQIISYKRFLNSNEDFQDVLKYIGVSQSDIKNRDKQK